MTTLVDPATRPSIMAEAAIPVNTPGAVELTRADVWKGLVMKAENAVQFIPMTRCDIKERISPTQFVRTIQFQGETMDELITLDEAAGTVLFERVNGALGTVWNFIETDAAGQLSLRFKFHFFPKDLVAGDEETHLARMRMGYTSAVTKTLERVRALKTEGTL